MTTSPPENPDVVREYATPYRVGPPVLEAPDSSPFQEIKSIRDGLPYSAFEDLSKRFGLSSKDFAKILAINPRTLTRRKKEGHLSPTESDQLRRVERVFNLAVEAMGDDEGARWWLGNPHPGFQNKKPWEFLDVEPGARLVETCIFRIVHGVYW